MRQQTRASKEPAEKVVQDIRRATRKHYSAEEKIRIVLEGLQREFSLVRLVLVRLVRSQMDPRHLRPAQKPEAKWFDINQAFAKLLVPLGFCGFE